MHGLYVLTDALGPKTLYPSLPFVRTLPFVYTVTAESDLREGLRVGETGILDGDL